ncbi:ArsC family reductase [Comamonas endophytica]|uniref:ArsC family reductase n=1 Tax=Comamonas endophytica TaxID=2949090 RepID=A0ABY6G8P3_9BURK|nr:MULTISPECIES: ArsC family reductase [unclassified Acidovorax]MCD2514121.1 ArsC family reductase [Acidovorax sp. D4N7]UYG51261.1 ArsC family reductase [Acidovorax sp. 5MLIR]
MIVYGIPNCDTVKKARQWLAAQGVAHEFHDFKKLGVPPAQLARWIDALGWEKLINRQGTTWRKLDPAAQADVKDAASATALALAQPSLIKRPVVEWPDGNITVGFQADTWQSLLTAGK